MWAKCYNITFLIPGTDSNKMQHLQPLCLVHLQLDGVGAVLLLFALVLSVGNAGW